MNRMLSWMVFPSVVLSVVLLIPSNFAPNLSVPELNSDGVNPAGSQVVVPQATEPPPFDLPDLPPFEWPGWPWEEPAGPAVPADPQPSTNPPKPDTSGGKEESEPDQASEDTYSVEVVPEAGSSKPGREDSGTVAPLGPAIRQLKLSSGSTTAGHLIKIFVAIDSARPGAARVSVSCGGVTRNMFIAVEEFSTIWNTRGCPAGPALITLATRDTADANWQNPAVYQEPVYISAAIGVDWSSVSFLADAGKISVGQCTLVHWNTAKLEGVQFEGEDVSLAGERQICPTETTKYTLAVESRKESYKRSLTVYVTPPDDTAKALAGFENGDVITMSGKIFVIVDGQRCLIPNNETFFALGLSRNDVDNRQLSDSDLAKISQGEAIPDKGADPVRFEEVKAYIYPTSTSLSPTDAEGSAVLPAGAPTKPAAAVLTAPPDQAVYREGVTLRFDWTGQDNDYLLKISGGPYGDDILCGWQPGTTCTVQELLEGNYTWQVKARSTAGEEGGWSEARAFAVQTGSLALPFIQVTSADGSPQAIGSCSLSCQIRLFGVKTWSALWNIPAPAPAVLPETVDGFLANYSLHEGSLAGNRRSDLDLVQRLNDFPGFGDARNADAYIKNGGPAQALTDISQIRHCSTLFLNAGGEGSARAVFVYAVDAEENTLTVIQQNYPTGAAVDVSEVAFGELDLASTYYVDSLCK